MKFNLTPKELKAAERSVYSQGGQDGVLEAIFNQKGVVNGRAVEFGAGDGLECSNTANLRLNHGWKVLLLDRRPKSKIVHNVSITPYNIDFLISDVFNFEDIDYISIDIDGNDYWVWKELQKRPFLISIEYNSKFRNDESFVVEFDTKHDFVWEGDDYYGASLLALKKLGQEKGYALVYVVDRFDAIFIRNDLIADDYIVPTLDELLPEPIIAFEKISGKKWVVV